MIDQARQQIELLITKEREKIKKKHKEVADAFRNMIPNNDDTTPTFESRFQQTHQAIHAISQGVSFYLLYLPIALIVSASIILPRHLLRGSKATFTLATTLDTTAKEKYIALRLLAAPITGLLFGTAGLIGLMAIPLVIGSTTIRVINKWIYKIVPPVLGYLGTALVSPFIFLAHHTNNNPISETNSTPKTPKSRPRRSMSTGNIDSRLYAVNSYTPTPTKRPSSQGDSTSTPRREMWWEDYTRGGNASIPTEDQPLDKPSYIDWSII